jgi:hypothetical protein
MLVVNVFTKKNQQTNKKRIYKMKHENNSLTKPSCTLYDDLVCHLFKKLHIGNTELNDTFINIKIDLIDAKSQSTCKKT